MNSTAPLGLPRYLALLGQLVLLTAAVDRLQLVSPAFRDLMVLTTIGYGLNCWLPARLRMPFFALLSMAGVLLVLGLETGSWLLCAGLSVIGLAHVPGPFFVRLVLVVAAAVLAGMARVDTLALPVPDAVWPLLGSMFMFRMAVFLYDRKHSALPASGWRTLAYFFCLPNVCFPLFPVIDYKTFGRCHRAEAAASVHQRGLRWISRGLWQLVLYRLVYGTFSLDPEEVSNAAQLIQYVLATYFLYLQVSGTFHIIAGMLLLFDFALPETHRLYFLAASFSDYWRRINIYWKDFMMKLFYYPMFFRLRRQGTRVAMVVATLFVFASTWLLHSYQWFWLRGRFPLHPQDMIFWGVLGVLVVIQTLREAGTSQQKRIGGKRLEFAGAVWLCLRVAFTFGFLCLLWSLWNSASLDAWWVMVRTSGQATLRDLPVVLRSPASYAGLAVGAGALALVAAGVAWRSKNPGRKTSPRFAAVRTALAALLLIVLGSPEWFRPVERHLPAVLLSLRGSQLNAWDAEALERGYYEDLLSTQQLSAQLFELYMKQPSDWHQLDALRKVRRFIGWELKPSAHVLFKEVDFSTSSAGFRDQEYARSRPPNTLRVALLGSSYVMGSGVADGEAFEAICERRLNDGSQGLRYEIINMAVRNYCPAQQLAVLDEKALRFEPDLVFFVAHANDATRTVRFLIDTLRRGTTLPYPVFQPFLDRAGGKDARMAELSRGLASQRFELLGAVYAELARRCRERGITPVWIYLPRLSESADAETVARLHELARESAFHTISLDRVFSGCAESEIRLREFDLHPNARGHETIAAALLDAIRSDVDLSARFHPGQ